MSCVCELLSGLWCGLDQVSVGDSVTVLLNTHMLTCLLTFDLCPFRLPSWRPSMRTWDLTRSKLGGAAEYQTSLLQQAGRSCCAPVCRDQQRTPRRCLSGSSVSWWGRSLGWPEPSPQTRPSFKSYICEQFTPGIKISEGHRMETFTCMNVAME